MRGARVAGWVIAIGAMAANPAVSAHEGQGRQEERQPRGARDPIVLRGHVRGPDGEPVEGADVFLLETLEGSITDSTGTFEIHTAVHGRATVIARRLGFEEARLRVHLPREAPLTIVIRREAVTLRELSVRVDAHAAGAGEPVEVTPLEVVKTPGSHADVLKAVGTLPGVQPVTEGAGLYVRGGDISETKVVLNGAVVLAPYQFESSLASFGTFDPFQLEGIAFSSGGFGARHGNALSGLLDLETVGRPGRPELNATVSLAALAAAIAIPLPGGFGVRGTFNRSSTELLFRLNGYGEEAEFTRAPESRNASVILAWNYRNGGRLKLYALDEWNRFGISLDRPAFAGRFSSRAGSRLAVLSFQDVAGSVGVAGSFSMSARSRSREFGAFRLDQGDRLAQGRLEMWRPLATGLILRGGVEAQWRESTLEGSYPAEGENARPGARVNAFDVRIGGWRGALFGEAEWNPLDRVELTAGLRSDRSSLAGVRTWDPRLSGALRLGDGAYLTFAWGRYHQVRAPSHYARVAGGLPNLAPMASTHRIIGFMADREGLLLRVEAYSKEQDSLSGMDRDYRVHGGGRGRTRGLDLFLRGVGRWGIRGRAVYSFIDAERTDPNTGEMARSPFEIQHALTLVLERPFGAHFLLSGQFRWASGRPFTPVIDAVRTGHSIWRPVYASPYSARLPTYRRIDLSGQYLHSFGGENLTVFFVSVTNLLDHVNVAGMNYNADYSRRKPVESAFRRMFYIGVTTTLPF